MTIGVRTQELGSRTIAELRSHPIEVADVESESLIIHVLFIDIVGYSKLSMEDQQRASSDLTKCVRRGAIFQTAFRSGALTCLDTGDGMAIAFEGNPTAPAFMAIEIADCRGKSPDYAIRMGIHSGPAIRVRDINGMQNFKGVGMNVTQRVMDCGDDGQIMMTEHYASILRSYEGWSTHIAYRGTQTVKHGVKLRVCELIHQHSPRHLLADALLRELPSVSAAIRWIGILATIAAFTVCLYATLMSSINAIVEIPAEGNTSSGLGGFGVSGMTQK
jgi:class 3 adenylate cyclase